MSRLTLGNRRPLSQDRVRLLSKPAMSCTCHRCGTIVSARLLMQKADALPLTSGSFATTTTTWSNGSE